MKVKRHLAAFAAPLLLSPAPATASDVYALVVGINDYSVYSDLEGALNDAHLVAKALQKFGARETRLLTDAAASRANVEYAWREMVDKALPGDTFVFHYAGHGHFVPDRDGDEASQADPNDQLDEILALPDYGPGAGAGEMILDDELRVWLREATDAGVKVVVVTDSCNSGTVTRGGRIRKIIDPYNTSIAPRSDPFGSSPIEDDYMIDSMENVYFLAGASEHDPVVEVAIDGRTHGALSYAFAKALSLAADENDDGALSRDELGSFVPRTAMAFNSGRYLPELVAVDSFDHVILQSAPATGTITGSSSDAGPQDQEVVPEADEVLLAVGDGMTWNRRTGDVRDGAGETVAFGVNELDLQEVNDKFEVLNLVREGVLRRGFALNLLSGGSIVTTPIRDGERMNFEIGPIPHPYLTVFNLANSGETQLVYPASPEERGPQAVNGKISFSGRAGAPYGVDHMVAISTPTEPRDLRLALLQALPPSELIRPLTRLIADRARFGMATAAVSR